MAAKQFIDIIPCCDINQMDVPGESAIVPKQRFFPLRLRKHSRFIVLFLVFLALLGVALTFLVRAFNDALAEDVIYPGITIEGIDVGGTSKSDAMAKLSPMVSTFAEEISLTVKVDALTYEYTQKDFDFTYDLSEVVEQAYAFNKQGNLLARYWSYYTTKSDRKDFDVSAALSNSEQRLHTIVAQIEEAHNRPVVEANIASFRPKTGASVTEMVHFSPEQSGVQIDTQKLYADLTSIITAEHKVGTATVQVEQVLPKQSLADLQQAIEPFQAFSTISKNTADGNYNMSLALKRINGSVIQPGETFSFNEMVQERTTKNGFRQAKVIVNGRFEDGTGGGICQVSTTLYGAVLRAGLTVVERKNHSRPSSYVPIGQDAMVNWGTSDFKFRNDSEYPVLIVASMSGTKLSVQLLGKHSDTWDEVEVQSWKTSTLPAVKAQYKNDSALAQGTQVVHSNGVNGATASAQRVFKKDGEVVKKEPIHESYYPSVGAEILVGTR